MSSDDEESPRALVFGERRVAAPPYVVLVERTRRVYAARCRATVELTRERGASVTIDVRPSDALASRRLVADAERLVLVDALVHAQHAASLPIDVVVRLAPPPARELVVERRLELSTRRDRLLVEALAYEHARPASSAEPIRFCSLDACGFERRAFERELRPLVAEAHDSLDTDARPDVGRVVLPRSTPYAELVRQVSRARQLESLDAVARACVLSDSIDGRCAVGSSLHVYESLEWLRASLDHVERVLAPAASLTRESLDEASVRPLDAATWRHALRHVDDAQLPALATLDFVAWFAVQNVKSSCK